MAHEREDLALRLEAGHYRLRVHALLDHLHRDPASHGLQLLGLPHLAHAALAHLLEQAIAAERNGGVRRRERDSVGVASSVMESAAGAAEGA
jgi:hypothetical protein